MQSRIKTSYPGVYYREIGRRGKKGFEKVFYIVFKKDGKVFEEKVGKQFEDAMTAAKAATIRGERIEGKRISRKEFKSKEQAKRLAEMNRWTVERLWEEYKKQNHDLKGLVQDENRFKNYLKPEFGDKEPRNISPFDVDKLRINLLKVRKPATVKNILELLRRVILFGEKRHLCDGLSFNIQMPKVNNQKTEDLSSEELKRLLKAIDTDPNVQAANLMKLVLFTGMRRGEVFKLRWNHINFEKGFIKIADPKGGIDQTIPLNDPARKILINHPKTASPFVFPGKDGAQRVDIKRQVNRIKQRAGLPKHFRALHGLRHVYASILASSGKVDLYTLQKLLTHKSPQMTQRYAHLRDEALRNASNLAGQLIEENELPILQQKKKIA